MLHIISLALSGLLTWSGVGAIEESKSVPHVFDPAPITIKMHSVRLTGYNAVPEQTDSNPEVTASGALSNPEVMAARSRDFATEMPFGTVIAIKSPENDRSCGFNEVEHFIGYRVITDTMHARKERQVDVMFTTTDTIRLGNRSLNPAVVVGICDVTVDVIGKLALENIPSTQAELAMIVNTARRLR
jgi:3D (Asp-Asp-Asp) domain-containing protein